MSAKHTPTPWCQVGTYIETTEKRLIAGMITGKQKNLKDAETAFETSKENAAFIVRAVNSHDELLAAAKRGIMALEANGAPNCEAVKELKAVITKAEGK